MTSDKEALEQQHQPTGKSAIFSPAPSLTNIGQPQTKLASRLQEGGQLVQKSKLILPTAIWILIVVGGLCFLSLLASLNKSINTLDSLVQQEQARVDINRKDKQEHEASALHSPISDLMSLPAWLSLDRQPFGRPTSGQNGLSTAETSIIITDSGSHRPQTNPFTRPLELLDSSSPFDSILSQLFGQSSSSDQVVPPAQEESKSGAPLIDKIHIDGLTINVNQPATEGDHSHPHPHQHRPHHKAHQDPIRPLSEAEELEKGSGSYNEMMDNMLLSMLKPPVRGPQEVGELSFEPPSDRRPERPIPMSPLAQLHLLPFEPETSVGGPRPHSPLDSSIPPMFGRPQDGQQAHIVIAQFGRPGSNTFNPFREPVRPTPDSNIEEPPRQADIPIRVISNEPDVIQSLELPKFNDESSSTILVKDDLEKASTPMTPDQQKSTSADDEISIKSTTNRVTDLFKMFFGEPKDSLVVRPSSEGPVEITSPPSVTIKVEGPSEDPIVKVPIEPFKGEQEGEGSEEKKDIEQLVDSVIGGMLSLPQMANERAPLKINSSIPILPAIIPVPPVPHAHRVPGPIIPIDKVERPLTNTSSMSQSSPSVSNKTSSATPIRTTLVVGLKADSIPTTTVAPETTTRKSGSSVSIGNTTNVSSSSDGTSASKAPVATTKAASGSPETPKPTTTTPAPTSKKPEKSFFEKADDFFERNISRFRKFLE